MNTAEMKNELEIKELHVEVDGKEILKGVSLVVKKGESRCPDGSKWLWQEHSCIYFNGASKI